MINGMKNVIENINIICITIILDGVKQRICEVESRSFYTIQQEENKENGMKSLKKAYINYTKKKKKILYYRSPRSRREGEWGKSLFKEIMAETSQHWGEM